MDLSIILVSYNTAQITKECIESIMSSLSHSAITYEVVVLDNDSSDDSIEQLTRLTKAHSHIRLIKNHENIGFGRGNNRAVRDARGTYILLLNTDTVVLNGAIEKLYNDAVHNPDHHFVGGKLLNKDQTPQPSCGPYYSLPVIAAALYLKGDHWNLSRFSPTKPTYVDWMSGACILTKKTIFEELGGFDEDIFMYMEEIDLLHRARTRGYRAYVLPDARFIHYGSLSSGSKTFPILQVYKGFVYLYKKHHSPLAQRCLRIMLQLKADIAIVVGRVTRNAYLVQTYGEAKKIISD